MIDCTTQDCNTCPINTDDKELSSETIAKFGMCIQVTDEELTTMRYGSRLSGII